MTYGQFREIYGYDVPDGATNITDKGFDNAYGGHTASPAEAARWNQTVKDIMDGNYNPDDDVTDAEWDALEGLLNRQ